MLMPAVYYASPFRVLSESSNEVMIEFEIPDWSLEYIDENGQKWQRIKCDGAGSFVREGYPELLSFTEAIGIPVDGDIGIQIINSESTTIKNVSLIPGKKTVVSDYDVDYIFHIDNRAYSNNALYPVNLVEKGSGAFIGDRRFVPLQLFPFQYNAHTKELRVSTSLKIRVSIFGTKADTKDWQLSENIIDDAADMFFLNNQSSKAWRLQKTKDNSYATPKNHGNQINDIQFVVDVDGIYKVTYQYLQQFIIGKIDSLGIDMRWMPSTVDPRYLELRDRTGPIPIHFQGESDGVFHQSDYFEFYGTRNAGKTGYSDAYTAENVYTLSLSDRLGARMVVENGGLVLSNPQQYIVPDAYEETVHFEEQIVTDKLGKGWEASNPMFYKEDQWFWKKISAPNLDIIPVELQYPIDSTIRTASVKVALHGLTYSENLTSGQYDHNAIVRLNQAMVNSHTWIGQKEKIFTNQNPIPNSYLRHGTNNFYVSLPGDTPLGDREQILFDYAQIKYWRQYKTANDRIKFTKPSNRPSGMYQFQVEGFSSSDISVYKIGSSIFNNLQIEPFNLNGIAPWTVTFQDSVASNLIQYYAVAESQKRSPKSIRLSYPTDLKNPSNASDLVVITVRELIDCEGMVDLKNLWDGLGYTVKLVDLQAIFDEFNYGVRSADSIKEFLKYAYNNWSSPQLRHVVLMGEGTDDERDNSPNRRFNLIPVKKMWTFKHGATASDNWYGCIVGDDIVADISVSRINVWTPTQIRNYADKSIQYHTNPMASNLWSSHITLTAGGKLTDPDDIFSQQSERIRRKSIPDHYRVSRVYTATQTVSSDYFGGTFALKDAINSGTQYVQFMGHGGGRIWADYNLFNFNDVATLNNQAYPFVMSLACYASAFDTPGAASISEALVTQPNKGAISTLGFSGLGYLYEDEDYGLALCEALFKHNFQSVGEAVVFAKARYYTTVASPAPRDALIIGSAYLGDPVIKFRKPQIDIPVSVNKYIFQPGDTLRVTASFPTGATAGRLYLMKTNEKTVNVPFNIPVVQDTLRATYVFPVSAGTNYLRRVYVAGFSNDTEYVGISQVAVGRSNVAHHALYPSKPTWRDSTLFSAQIHAQGAINSVSCYLRTDGQASADGWTVIPMQRIDGTDVWQTSQKFNAQRTGREVRYKYVLNESGVNYESPLYSYVTSGPDLILSDIRLVNTGTQLAVEVFCKNIGDAASITTDLRLYVQPQGQPNALYKSQDLMPFDVNEGRWETIQIDSLFHANVTLEVRANWTSAFSEWEFFYNTNNIISMQMPFNFFSVGESGAVISSIDQNLSCEVPALMVPSGHHALFSIQELETLDPLNQPDISGIKLRTGITSKPYDIRVLDSTLVDSLGVLANGRLRLSFYYSVTDSLTQLYENENSYRIYRWDQSCRKWVLQGGIVSTSQNRVFAEVNRTGIYTIYRNRDRIRPSIDVNVQDQEFTIGGYISGTGTISILLSDANGIDVIDNSIKLSMNGVEIPSVDYVTTINPQNINRIPIKYQINLGRGTYSLVIDCTDVNGNFNSREVQFNVNDVFDIVKVANYPNPVVGRAQDPKNDGRTRFTYVLTDDADAVSIKVYTVSGRLVKRFDNLATGVGYHEFPRTLYGWDCKDEQGFQLANGVYFYKVTARKGGKSIEKTQKMAILR